jgi:4-hydroxythreonine-4-phosphate dehydrogenase
MNKPKIGISLGDINGIGPEVVIKSLMDSRILDHCIPIIFGNSKVVNFYRKAIPDANFSYTHIKDINACNPKQVNIYTVWDDEVQVTPGELNDTGGLYAHKSLAAAAAALKDGAIDILVTAPIHKKNIQSATFPYSGHTPYLQATFAAKDVLMFMLAENIKVGLVTEHVAVKDVAQHLSIDKINSKLALMHKSLKVDFGIDKPRIAVLGLNPHAGDEGLIGKEEQEIIIPAIRQTKQSGIMAFGPYPADAFFARHMYAQFDAVLAMYHDQGLIPFKSLAIGEGVNYTAGLNGAIRTSPDHGTGFDIAGKNQADHYSFLAAIYKGIDVYNMQNNYHQARENPLRKMSGRILANAVDERIEMQPESE